jgi:hypothetical protein
LLLVEGRHAWQIQELEERRVLEWQVRQVPLPLPLRVSFSPI